MYLNLDIITIPYFFILFTKISIFLEIITISEDNVQISKIKGAESLPTI